MVCLALLVAWVLMQDGVTQRLPPAHLSAEGFARAFEDAFVAGDTGRMEQLVRENPTEFVPLSLRYEAAWIAVRGTPQERDRRGLAQAKAIGEAVDTVFKAQGLLEMADALEEFDEEKRQRWSAAMKDQSEGMAAYDRFAWQDAIAPFERAEAELSDLAGATAALEDTMCLGACFQNLGLFEKALSRGQRALEISMQLGDPRFIASAHNNVGLVWQARGQLEKALDCFQKGLDLREQVADPAPLSSSLNNIGVCYLLLGQYDRAITYLRKALEIRQPIGNAEDVAVSLDNIAICYSSLGQAEKAIGYQEEALALEVKVGDPIEIARSLVNLGNSHEELGQFEEAFGLFQQALARQEPIGNPVETAGSLGSLGNACYGLGQYDRAINYHEKALALLEPIGNAMEVAASLANLGACYCAAEQYDRALALLERSTAQFDRVSRRTFSERDRSHLLALRDEIPSLVSRVVQRLLSHENTRAVARGFPLVEAFTGHVLLEGLQEKAEGALSAFDPELAAARAVILDRMTQIPLQLEREASGEQRDKSVLEELRRELEGEQAKLDTIDHRLRQKNARLGELITPREASLESVQHEALGSEDALLLYVLDEESSFLWVIRKDAATVVELRPEGQIKEQYDQLSRALSEGARHDRTFIDPARALFEMLLAGAKPFIQSCRNLIIVPDGFLGFLPFEVLLTRDVTDDERSDFSCLPYLLREKSVRYTPSASLLVWFANHAISDRAWKKDLLLFGDPIYASERRKPLATGNSPDSRGGEGWLRLKKTGDEVKAIAASLSTESEAKTLVELRDLPRSGHVTGSRFDLYVGSEASKTRLRQDLTGYRILHLATHGLFDTRWPWLSGLVLSAEGEEEPSGFVNLIEIGTLSLDAQIVFLSACETAKGEMTKAEGIKNTARSFLLAGAQSVVATQWNVMDAPASIVANGFYQKLFQGSSPAEALRAAKLALIEQRDQATRGQPFVPGDTIDESLRRWAHPSFWAPFVLWGG